MLTTNLEGDNPSIWGEPDLKDAGDETGWDEESLWCTDTMPTELENVFRSLKSELGLRPVYGS